MLLPIRIFVPIVALLGFAQGHPVDNALSTRSVPYAVLGPNFPDPSLHYADGAWYSFATRTPGESRHVQVGRSYDFISWELLDLDALPTLPGWVAQSDVLASKVWAPDVVQNPDGQYLLYYSAAAVESPDHHCVGAATSWNIAGPYAAYDAPMFCDLNQGGAIDASHFWDIDDKRYAAYKIDGNSLGAGMPTPLMLQQVDPSNGVTPLGAPVVILTNDNPADGGIVEAPYLIRTDDGTYILFYSSGNFNTNQYTVSWASSASVTGPYERRGVLLKSGDYGLEAPGGMSIGRSEGGTQRHAVFHAGNVQGKTRAMYEAIVDIQGSSVSFV
ncbi:MAG: hypothetical protein M1828_004667 [Chrysothrix sp. TS-e1954]|nr:MAG: hypothetical protein M1828_004667 [Chrysothrix sp. TS-e1954]